MEAAPVAVPVAFVVVTATLLVVVVALVEVEAAVDDVLALEVVADVTAEDELLAVPGRH